KRRTATGATRSTARATPAPSATSPTPTWSRGCSASTARTGPARAAAAWGTRHPTPRASRPRTKRSRRRRLTCRRARIAGARGSQEPGSTVVVVGRDAAVMRQADYLIDMGPGGGRQGGRVLASGTVEEVLRNPNSVTAPWLAHSFLPSPGRGEGSGARGGAE